MKPLIPASTAAALLMSSAMLAAQTQQQTQQGRGNAPPQERPTFEIFRVEGQPIDKRPPELETDHPVFPGQTHAPYHKTVDVNVTTIAANLETPWGLQLLPSGRFLISEKPGRFRILNSDGSPFHVVSENLPPISRIGRIQQRPAKDQSEIVQVRFVRPRHLVIIRAPLPFVIG